MRGLKEYGGFLLSREQVKVATFEGTSPKVKCRNVNYGKFQIIEYYNTFEEKVICLAKNGHMGMSKSLTYGSTVNPEI